MVEGLSILGAVAELIQIYLLGKRNKHGFTAGMVASILWIAYAGITLQAYGIFLIAPVGFFLNVIGYKKWSKQERDNGQS